MKGMVVDSSAIFAILLGEEDQKTFHDALIDADPIMSAASRVEIAHAAPRRFGPEGVQEVEELLTDYGVTTEPLDEAQASAAITALIAYGKGRGRPPAVLNMGDAFSYALAKVRGLPLLYKGEDFARTDIRSALTQDQ